VGGLIAIAAIAGVVFYITTVNKNKKTGVVSARFPHTSATAPQGF